MIAVADLVPWFTLIALVLSLGNSFWVLMTRGFRHTADTVKEHDHKLAEHDRRIQSVESEMQHLPSKDEVHQLGVALTEIRGKLETVDNEMSSMSRTVNRIDEYLRMNK